MATQPTRCEGEQERFFSIQCLGLLCSHGAISTYVTCLERISDKFNLVSRIDDSYVALLTASFVEQIDFTGKV